MRDKFEEIQELLNRRCAIQDRLLANKVPESALLNINHQIVERASDFMWMRRKLLEDIKFLMEEKS